MIFCVRPKPGTPICLPALREAPESIAVIAAVFGETFDISGVASSVGSSGGDFCDSCFIASNGSISLNGSASFLHQVAVNQNHSVSFLLMVIAAIKF